MYVYFSDEKRGGKCTDYKQQWGFASSLFLPVMAISFTQREKKRDLLYEFSLSFEFEKYTNEQIRKKKEKFLNSRFKP